MGQQPITLRHLLVPLVLLWAQSVVLAGDWVEPGESTILSREMCTGLFVLPLSWASSSGEQHDLLAVFDTGGSNAFIDPDTLERLSGQRIKPGKRINMENVSAAGRRFSTFKPRVRDLDHLGRALGRRFDVFIPFQAFGEFLLTLDYQKPELRIARGKLPRPDGREVFSARGPDRRPWLSLRIGNRQRKLLIDSGSNGIFAINPHRRLKWTENPIPLRVSQMMTELKLEHVGRLDETVAVGRLDFDQPVVAVTYGTELMGAQVMQNFVWTFDQENRRVRMTPNTRGPVRIDSQRGTGALMAPQPDGFRVAHLVEGSPAQRSGLRRDDLVTHVNGVYVPERGCRELLPEPRQQQRYRILRDGHPLDLTIPVETLVP
ncbi:MAG: hypothetical protein QNJ40_07395 [Xanthomonadales bacterium]|nr:hypothetical protein [Xanthomonadales bacterium]